MANASEYESFLSSLMTDQSQASDAPPEPKDEPPATDDNVRIGDTVTFVPSQPVEVEEVPPPPAASRWPKEFAEWLARNGG